MARGALGWLGGGGDPMLRHEYNERLAAGSFTRRRVIAGVGSIVYAQFGFGDHFVAPGHVAPLLIIRAVMVLLLAGVVPVLPRFSARGQMLLVGGELVLTGWALDLMMIVTPARELTSLALPYLIGGNILSVVAMLTLDVTLAAFVPTSILLLAGFEAALPSVGGPSGTFLISLAAMLGAFTMAGFGVYLIGGLRWRDFLGQRELAAERERSDALLHSILPVEIAAQLKLDPTAIAQALDAVTVVFADVVGFTPVAAELQPIELVRLLDALFVEFDGLCQAHGVEKIKTIGDAYMAVAGVPRPDPDHAAGAAAVALGMLEVARRFEDWPGRLQLRVGLSSGPAVAGVIGRDKFAYDLWGDTVNTASRMESHGSPGRILVSDATRLHLGDAYIFSEPFMTEVKGKGTVTTYYLEGSRN